MPEIGGCEKLRYGCCLTRVNFDSSSRHHMTQVRDFGLCEGAFLEVSIKLMFPQQVQDLLEVNTMLLGDFAIDENII